MGVEKADLDTLLAKADFITLHTPLTDQTRNILSAENLAKTKKGVRIVNCARGGLIDEAALKEALDSAAMSPARRSTCLPTEPAKDSPLFGTPNFICTPHLGASTNEAQVNVALQVAEQMADYLVNGGVTNALNMPSLQRRGSAEAAALHGAGRSGWVRWSASWRTTISTRSRSRSKAPPPSSTSSRSPARCWPG